MPRKVQELTAVFEWERARFDETAILSCRLESGEKLPNTPNDLFANNDNAARDITVKCTDVPEHGLTQGLSYRFYGFWTKHPKYGPQFQASTYIHVQPHGRTGIIRYIQQCDGIGSVMAVKLWDKFAGEAVAILRTKPEVAAAAVDRLTIEVATKASKYLQFEAALEDSQIAMMDLLGGHGFPKRTGKMAIEEWGSKAPELIQRNPYLLMQLPGVGFLRCDNLYLKLGHNPGRLKRQALCAWHALNSDMSGHTWYAPQEIEQGLRTRISGATVTPIRATRLAVRAGLLSAHRADSGNWFAESKAAENEEIVAGRVNEWMTELPAWPSIAELDVSDHQRLTLAGALARPLAVFTGGPGTGKTYSAARLIEEIITKYGMQHLAVAAPTGKAAVRITEVMRSHKIALRARTIHSLLGVESNTRTGGWAFTHNENCPLPYKFIVVDEASMIDTDLCASLFRACASSTHVLLVGDVGQLPPVGHGAPLRDLIGAGVPTGELTEIRRNSGKIVESCHEIRGGKRFRVCSRLNPAAGENLGLVSATDAKKAVERIVQTLKHLALHGLAEPVWECQVVCAVNRKSALSRKDINKRLQLELNPDGEQAKGNPFRVMDKIVCLKNGFYPVVEDAPREYNEEANEDGKVFVANGEQAEVVEVQPRITMARLTAPKRWIKIPRGNSNENEQDEDDAGTGCKWDLAYAISCHKSQGSEWPVVLVALDEYPGARMVCSREWLYTAISRAKKVCYLVGKLETGHSMVLRQAIRKRKTFLAEAIRCDAT
jgi:exodeoxyribonuclease V alpha subunit